MEDSVALAKAAVEGFVQEAHVEIEGGHEILAVQLGRLRERVDGVIDQLAQRLAMARTDVLGIGYKRVTETLADRGSRDITVSPAAPAAMRPLTAAESLPVLYPLSGTVKS